MCLIVFCFDVCSVWRLLELEADNETVVIRALDLITIVVPPALPMVCARMCERMT